MLWIHVDVSLPCSIQAHADSFRDLSAERVQLEGGGDGWRFTKSHAVYEKAVADHAQQQLKLRALLDLLLPCLVLALPRGSGGGGLGAAAAEGEAPPAKAPRLV